jgi:pimeloyl-ACP methyl ester carboxylesterase
MVCITNIYYLTGEAKENVLFIHGFISSSLFWTETLFPNFSSVAKSSYRLFAVDLLGFGKSPKPSESLYTLREHLDMIEKSVLEAHKVQSFHIVAHSLGSILALALAAKYPQCVKSITLIAPVSKIINFPPYHYFMLMLIYFI